MRRLHSSAVPGQAVKIAKDANGNYVNFLGKKMYVLSVAITANTTATTATAGSLGMTTHATGGSSIFRSDGAHWQALA